MKLTYWSHSCFLLETKNHNIVFDPFLTGNPKAKVKPEEVKCDFILVTHGHGDHLGDAVDIAKRNNATIISNFEVATYCGKQGANVHPMHIGGGREFPFGRVKLTIAHHGSGLDTEDGFIYLGNPVGFLLMSERKTLYNAGDTGLFLDMQLIAELNPIDVALLPIGDNFTMGIDDACKALEFLKPKVAIPMHYKTFDLIDADPHEFRKKAEDTETFVEILDIGQTFEF